MALHTINVEEQVVTVEPSDIHERYIRFYLSYVDNFGDLLPNDGACITFPDGEQYAEIDLQYAIFMMQEPLGVVEFLS